MPEDKTVHTISLTERVHFCVIYFSQSAVFCDATPCSPVRVHRRFEGTYCLHLQERKLNQARNQHGSACQLLLLVYCLAFSSTLEMKAMCCSETSGVLGTTQCYNPEGPAMGAFNFPSWKEFININLKARQIILFLSVKFMTKII